MNGSHNAKVSSTIISAVEDCYPEKVIESCDELILC